VKKLSVGIYATCGIVISLLALSDFVTSNGTMINRVMMLTGLISFGIMYIGVAIGTAFSKTQRHFVLAKSRRVWVFVLLGLLLSSVMIGWGMSLHKIQLSDYAIALAMLTVPISNCVDAFVVPRRTQE
jgi:hypothetical protein